MLRNITFGLLVIIAYLILTTFGSQISLGGVSPNLVIIVVCMYSLLRGRRAGMIFGFCAGLLLDVFYGYGDVIGINALIYMYIGLVNGFFYDSIYIKSYHVPIISVFFSDFAYLFVFYVITFLLRNKLNIGYYLNNIMIPEVVYTVFVTLLTYKLYVWLEERFIAFEQRGETKVD